MRARGDRGAAVVEMTIVGIILIFLLLGIIAYGFLMGFRQNMVQAAAEGARRGAVEDNTTAQGAAQAGAQDAVSAFNQTCGSGGMSCVATVAACSNKPAVECVTVRLEYDYAGHPLLPTLPFLDQLLPSTIVTQSVAEIDS